MQFITVNAIMQIAKSLSKTDFSQMHAINFEGRKIANFIKKLLYFECLSIETELTDIIDNRLTTKIKQSAFFYMIIMYINRITSDFNNFLMSLRLIL